MIKEYSFTYGHYEASATFKVDTERFSHKLAQETLDFFGWYYNKSADPVDEVMRKYGMMAIKLATFNGHNVIGVISDFEELEGFCRIDGTMGIELIEVSEFDFDDNELYMVSK